MASPRTLHIRCSTWEQVEAFYSRKLRRGRLLSMRVPFAPSLGSELTVGLELPSHAVMTIDGAVRKCEPSDGDAKHWIEIELVGLSDEMLRQLRDLVATKGASAAATTAPTGPRSRGSTTVPPPLAARSGPVAAPAAGRAAVVDSGISVIRGTDEVTPLEQVAAQLQAAAAPTVHGKVPPPRTPLAPPAPASSAALASSSPSSSASSSEDTVPRAARITGSPASASAAPVGGLAAAAAHAAGAPPSAVPALEDELPGDERELFAQLSGELRRLRQAAVHEVLGVSRDARAEEIRAGWMAHIRRFHPDVMARHRSDAVSHLAEELTILGNRAYDRLRVALVAEGRGAAFGPALFTPHGWLVGFEDLSTSDVPAARVLAAARAAPQATLSPTGGGRATPPTGGGAGFGVTAGGTGMGPSPFSPDGGFEHVPSGAASRTGESFEAQARELLGSGDAGGAREVLATALVVYPRSRPLRSLYYVASALTALAAGQIVLATSQLETALAHHEGCVEASLLLDQIHRNGGTDYEALRRLFQ